MPLYLTTDSEASPISRGLGGRGPKLSIEATIVRWTTPDLDTSKKIYNMLNDLNANIHRLQWMGWCLLALGSNYIFGKHTVHEKVLRRESPAAGAPDDEAYMDLRPGVMIASKSGHENYNVMTTSEHGFPGGVDDQVLHSDHYGRIIAEISKAFGETDISLPKLADVHCSRETFSTPDAPVSPFRSLHAITQLHVGEFIYMDTPYNGRCEGILVKVDVLQFPSDIPGNDVEYVIGAFGYFGNGADALFEGCCESVIWNSNHDVLGQFSFQQDGADNLCYFPMFDTL